HFMPANMRLLPTEQLLYVLDKCFFVSLASARKVPPKPGAASFHLINHSQFMSDTRHPVSTLCLKLTFPRALPAHRDVMRRWMDKFKKHTCTLPFWYVTP